LTGAISEKLRLLPPQVQAKIRAFSTDTASVMQAAWRELKNSAFPNAIFIPCEAHRLNLLVGDIVALPEFAEVYKLATALVNYLRNAPKLYALLGEYQVKILGELKLLVVSVLTRWGTTFRLADRLLKNEFVLRQMIHDPRTLQNDKQQQEAWD
jgi:hypothetical protein